jgi:hypothetical protein
MTYKWVLGYGYLFYSHDEKAPFSPGSYGQWSQKVTDHYAVIFDFELDILYPLDLDKELYVVSAFRAEAP